jgi:hypothetical protein
MRDPMILTKLDPLNGCCSFFSDFLRLREVEHADGTRIFSLYNPLLLYFSSSFFITLMLATTLKVSIDR